MKPSPNRNRAVDIRRIGELAHDYRRELNRKECAQKESNLQPADSKRRGDGSVIPFPPRLAVVTAAPESPTKTESDSANRDRNVTADYGFSGTSHKPYALTDRPDLLGWLFATARVWT